MTRETIWTDGQRPRDEIYSRTIIYFSNGGHTFRQIKTPDTILDLDTIMTIWAKFGLNPFSSFSGEDLLKS